MHGRHSHKRTSTCPPQSGHLSPSRCRASAANSMHMLMAEMSLHWQTLSLDCSESRCAQASEGAEMSYSLRARHLPSQYSPCTTRSGVFPKQLHLDILGSRQQMLGIP